MTQSRASRGRDRAEAALIREQVGIVREQRLAQHRVEAAGYPWWHQRTVRDMLRVLLGGG